MKRDIVAIIGHYLDLTKRKANYFGLCPFHKEKTPSFAVYPLKDTFHCFGCGAEGNSKDFIDKWLQKKRKGFPVLDIHDFIAKFAPEE